MPTTLRARFPGNEELLGARPGERWRLTLPPAPLHPDGQIIEGEIFGVGDMIDALPPWLRHHGLIRVAIKPQHLPIVYPPLRWVRAAERIDNTTTTEATHA